MRSHAPIRVEQTVEVGTTFRLPAETVPALRLRDLSAKEALTVVDAAGQFFRASLLRVGSDGAEATVYEALRQSPESPLHLTLVCAILGRQRMLQVIQKATELGVHRIVPVFSERSVQPAELDKEKPWAWPAQAVRAMRQCRRAVVPVVEKPHSLAHALESVGSVRTFVMDDQLSPAVDAPGNPREAALCVGPEGGWSDAERAVFARTKQVEALRLGSRILRAETAVYVGLSLLQHRYGDFSG